MEKITSSEIEIVRQLFKGREDVFAVRWEKGNKSGYMPAYSFDPYHYRVHKANGGTFQSYEHKSYRPLSDEEIRKHLIGHQQIGVYPLLLNDATWFLAADFDEKDWQIQAVKFVNACKDHKIPAYLERSRSGNGGHVWIFFDRPYAAKRSRQLFLHILESCGAFSRFDKGSSFDRLFPNQDARSSKGFGNLIALPLYLPTLQEGNSSFVDPETLEPFPDQWSFLRQIQRMSIDQLDRILEQSIYEAHVGVDQKGSFDPGILTVILSNVIRLNRHYVPAALVKFLKDELNFVNSAFIVKKKSGRSTYGTPGFFQLIKEIDHDIVLPRGFIGKLLRFCRGANIKYEFRDQRVSLAEITFDFKAALRQHQEKVVDIANKKDLGVIVAPPGAGKTVIGLKIISDKKQPALIIVHRRQLMDQWTERIEAFLGIPKKEIGKIGQGKAKFGSKVTIATIQSLSKHSEAVHNRFGIVLIDECHHIPADSYRETIESLGSMYSYGLTATPFRKHNDDKLIFAYIGDVISEILPSEIENYKRAKIVIRNTGLNVPYNSKTDPFETLSKILIHDTARNSIIVNDVAAELNRGRKVVIITERKDHIDTLNLLLKTRYETVTLSGDDSDRSRAAKWQILSNGNFQLLITTGQYFGEGSDIQHISTLFLAYPFSFHGKLIQYIGRVQRSEINPTIYDYRDHQIDYLDKLFLKRNTYYRKIDKQATLFDEPVEEPKQTSSGLFVIDKVVKVPIDDLNFHYGHVAFRHLVREMHTTVEFHIENVEIRPELDVLKLYFVKMLKSKNITVHLQADFEYGKLVSQLAISEDIDRINKEIVEGVKFQFLNDGLLKKSSFRGKAMLTAEQLQENQSIYGSGEALLADILKQRQYKHSRQIQFLADRHQSDIMKIRFVLSPFSFVFLLTGDRQYHIVLETLDTEEATYIWHTEKSRTVLMSTVYQIDQDLRIIREKGRQTFLETDPADFSRVVHDYSDPAKGFILWKSLLEEVVL